jgi:sugar phosphate isomerase/epimerase
MRTPLLALLAGLVLIAPGPAEEPVRPAGAELSAPERLVAWCIVPFDGKKRSPEARVALLQQLGLRRYAYDWRAEHLPSFETELQLLKKAGITLQAVWFPAAVGKDGETLLALLAKHNVSTQLWVMLPQPDSQIEQTEKVKVSAQLVQSLAERAEKNNCSIGIYNHGGWTGDPANMLAILKAAGKKNIGIVYNLHHAHDQLDRLKDSLKEMMPHLYAVNLNGMDSAGDRKGRKILAIAEGQLDEEVLKVIRDSGYRGPLGILGHTQHDVALRLEDNLQGLRFLEQKINGQIGDWPAYKTTAGNTLQVQLEQDAPSQTAGFVISGFSPKSLTALQGLKPTDDLLTQSVRVYVAKPGTPTAELLASPAMLGNLATTASGLRWTPRFPLAPGLRYFVRINFGKLNGHETRWCSTTFALNDVTLPATTSILSVSPMLAKLPENTLRMYVEFSHPMTKGHAYEHITLLKEDGSPVKFPFLELEEELWAPGGTRLTLLFDPGRVKRGLKPREEDGPILEEGKKFTLVISPKWKDQNGAPLKAEFRHTFDVLAPDDRAIDPAKWVVTTPKKFQQPVLIQFEKSLDRALVQRMIQVRRADGQEEQVQIRLSARQDQVELHSANRPGNWQPGKYKLVIDHRLEDLCGNRVGEPFELDVLKPIPKKQETKTTEIPFTIE